jgi:hypothetical protein
MYKETNDIEKLAKHITSIISGAVANDRKVIERRCLITDSSEENKRAGKKVFGRDSSFAEYCRDFQKYCSEY